ncbi:MAG: 2-hydroxyacyl-CoA dehydratase family protein [Planctomycetota bacterium]|jgi:benzoyl-CoA reductase/2-hydroxyglutaryl-CoA dehydratase subunit BcrC/BadD/HgdB|nr:2-hydroxyacyl-CoA dehydratase family protein [Planctomycetota bacterium]
MLGPKLTTRFDIFAHYAHVAELAMPVAWCSAFAPAEVLLAAGIMPVYPENHAAMLGALSPERNHDKPYSADAIIRAEEAGYTAPKLCSYARADIGALINDAHSPIGGLPKPDLFYACNSQCSVVARWGDAVQAHCAERGDSIPHFVLHAPPLRSGEAHSAEAVVAFEAELRGQVAELCERFGTRFDEDRLAAVTAESAAANRLWQRCLQLGAQRPSPWTMFDAFQAMAPIVIARGTQPCTDFYRRLVVELETRVAEGVAAVPNEQRRLLWDAIPIWPRKNWLANFFAERNTAMVVSTYTHSWWFELDPDRAMRSLCERYAWNTMNRSGQWVLDWTLGLARDFGCNGIVSHWNQSCGIWNSYVKRRQAGYRAAGMPQIMIEADMVDPRAFNENTIAGQLDTFIADLAIT